MGLFFGFFIALFGMIYIMSRATVETVQTNRSNQSYEDFRTKRRLWVSRVTDDHLEYLSGKDDYRIAVKEKDEVLKELFGERAEWFDRNAVHNAVAAESLHKIVYLANRGKLPLKCAQSAMWFYTKYRSDLSKDELFQLSCDCRKFVYWVDSKLAEHGIRETLYVGFPAYWCYCLAKNTSPDFLNFYAWAPSVNNSWIYPDQRSTDEAIERAVHPSRRK